jgi:hypothetical protein
MIFYRLEVAMAEIVLKYTIEKVVALFAADRDCVSELD